jgi:hypothetical protein
VFLFNVAEPRGDVVNPQAEVAAPGGMVVGSQVIVATPEVNVAADLTVGSAQARG